MSDLDKVDVVVDSIAFKSVVGIIGNIFAMMLFIAPITLMIKLHKRQVDPLKVPYLIMMMNIMNCVLWLSYGIIMSDIFLCVCNGVGFGLNLIYLCLYFYYRNRKNYKLGLVFGALAVISTFFILVLYAWAIKSQELAQYSAMIFNIFMYAAPGQKIREVVKTGDNRLIPLPSTVVGLLSSIAWLTYGILPIFNIFIVIPNGLGVLLSLFNIFFYFYYLNSTKKLQVLEKKLAVKKVNESTSEISKDTTKNIQAVDLNQKANTSSSRDTKVDQNTSTVNLNQYLEKPKNEASAEPMNQESQNVTIENLKDLDRLPNDLEMNSKTEPVIVRVP